MIIETRFLLWLKWISTVICLTGALLTSFQITPYNIIVLNIGAVLFIVWSIGVKDKAMITINAGFLIIYSAGVIKSLL
jgi:hypothetical protein